MGKNIKEWGKMEQNFGLQSCRIVGSSIYLSPSDINPWKHIASLDCIIHWTLFAPLPPTPLPAQLVSYFVPITIIQPLYIILIFLAVKTAL